MSGAKGCQKAPISSFYTTPATDILGLKAINAPHTMHYLLQHASEIPGRFLGSFEWPKAGWENEA